MNEEEYFAVNKRELKLTAKDFLTGIPKESIDDKIQFGVWSRYYSTSSPRPSH